MDKAESVFRKVYGGETNFITPHIEYYGTFGPIVYEVSSGRAISAKSRATVYGVTVLIRAPETALGWDKEHDFNKGHIESMDEVKAYIEDLKVKFTPDDVEATVTSGDNCDVYVGNPSIWGNKFRAKNAQAPKFHAATLEIALQKYRDWLLEEPRRDKLAALRGKKLGCMKHQRAFAYALADVVNNLPDES